MDCQHFELCSSQSRRRSQVVQKVLDVMRVQKKKRFKTVKNVKRVHTGYIPESLESPKDLDWRGQYGTIILPPPSVSIFLIFQIWNKHEKYHPVQQEIDQLYFHFSSTLHCLPFSQPHCTTAVSSSSSSCSSSPPASISSTSSLSSSISTNDHHSIQWFTVISLEYNFKRLYALTLVVLKQARKPRSYASPKLRLTYLLTHWQG